MNYDSKTGDITKDGEIIGVFVSDEKTVRHAKPIAPTVKGQIKKLIEAEGFEVASFQQAPADDGMPPENREGLPPMPPIPRAPARAKNIPPCPPSDPAMGDKTPAVMAWYRKHHPEQYRSRYQNRVTPANSGAPHPSAVPSFVEEDDEDEEQEDSRVIA